MMKMSMVKDQITLKHRVRVCLCKMASPAIRYDFETKGWVELNGDN